MKILRSFKTELDLNNVQKTACAQHAGAARWAYNWGLARKMAAYQAGEKLPTAIDLYRELTRRKKTDLQWLYSVSKCAPQEALRNLDQAYANFFRRIKQRKPGGSVKAGFPRFKAKKNGRGSFRLYGTIRIFERSIQLPRLGRLRFKEQGYLPQAHVQIVNVTLSEKAGRWFVSVLVEMEIPDPEPAEKPGVGVDLGINRMAQVSNGMIFENPRAYKRALGHLRRLQQIVSRRQTGSANRQKAARRLAKAHARVANIRKDTVHKATSLLAKTKSAVVLEDLSLLAKSEKLSKWMGYTPG